jgi:signal transduction histidine kinase
MNLKKLLYITTFFILTAFLLTSFVMYSELRKYEKAVEKSRIAVQIAHHVFERRSLSDDYLFNQVDRARIQWYSKQTSIENLVKDNEYLFISSQDLELFEVIKRGLKDSRKTFDELVAIYQGSAMSDPNTREAQRAHMAGQLGIKMQETVSAAALLNSINQQSADNALANIFSLFGVTTVSFFILLVVNFFIFRRGVNIEKELEKMKDEFVSIASHELRTPLTAIKGLISMMFEGDYGEVPPTIKQPLNDVYVSAERLIALVNDLLNVARIEAGRTKFSLANFKLIDLVGPVVNTLQPIAKPKGVELYVEKVANTEIQTDKDKFYQILNNLISNAIKFTDTGSIVVSANVVGSLVNIVVVDSGIGISQVDQAKLFGKFQQISNQKEGRPAGTGLGLYISKQLAKKMGGDVWIVKSAPDKGSTFGFSVPVANSDIAIKMKKQWQKYS